MRFGVKVRLFVDWQSSIQTATNLVASIRVPAASLGHIEGLWSKLKGAVKGSKRLILFLYCEAIDVDCTFCPPRGEDQQDCAVQTQCRN